MILDFSDLPLKVAYDSGEDDLVWDFYIPVLSRANSYDRIAGFFSSSSLAIAARGISEFISNGGVMRLVTCPQLSSNDISMLEKSVNNIDEILSDHFIKSYDEIETEFQRDHVKALGWMLANGKLQMKISVIKNNGRCLSQDEIVGSGIMHQKVGIMRDQAGNILTFSGSNNESVSGWMGNTEEFKVFMSWEGMTDFINSDIQKFNSFWSGSRNDVEIRDVPQAVKEHLLKVSSDFEPTMISSKKYSRQSIGKEKQPLKLFYYQENAVKKWNDNNRQLLLQMATGTGKTRTAIGCIKNALEDTKKILIIISTPQPDLSSQWKTDIDKLDIGLKNSMEINGNVLNWDIALSKEIRKLSTGLYEHLVVYTTHDICHSEKFLDKLQKSSSKITKFLVGDEVHGMGAGKMKNALVDDYTYRLGLSATPQRWFDDAGSKLIEEYFGNDSFIFSIEDALREHNPLTGKTFLVNYHYHPRFITMTDDELEEYKKLTEKIRKASCYSKNEENEWLQRLRFQRAGIEKKARNKYNELKRILDEIGEDITDTIIFVDPGQINEVMRILASRNITATPYTQQQGTKPSARYGGRSERDYIIERFKIQKYQVLVAIKCLDEGIDIPSAKRAIVMASSTNPREYVQRIGRIIRQAPGKYQADIYDMIIKPDLNGFNDEMRQFELRIFKKEMDRVLDLSRNALDNVTVCNTVYSILREVQK
ncbi:MAG: DEAD/DEAH box helicase family protein [Oscillospiraceae bacterium]